MKPRLSFWQILNMNVGFFGIQFSFGLQQANMSPIYAYLGADGKSLPLLWLAGPVTGLIVQPIVGALSDRTGSKHGRRTRSMLVGASTDISVTSASGVVSAIRPEPTEAPSLSTV